MEMRISTLHNGFWKLEVGDHVRELEPPEGRVGVGNSDQLGVRNGMGRVLENKQNQTNEIKSNKSKKIKKTSCLCCVTRSGKWALAPSDNDFSQGQRVNKQVLRISHTQVFMKGRMRGEGPNQSSPPKQTSMAQMLSLGLTQRAWPKKKPKIGKKN